MLFILLDSVFDPHLGDGGDRVEKNIKTTDSARVNKLGPNVGRDKGACGRGNGGNVVCLGIENIAPFGGLSKFRKAVAGEEPLFKPIGKCRDDPKGRGIKSHQTGFGVHFGIIGFTTIRDTLKATEFAIHGSKEVSHLGVVGRIFTHIEAIGLGKESGRSQNILFDRRSLDAATVNIMAKGQVDSIEGKLELATEPQIRGIALKERVVKPVHMVTEVEIMEPAGTNRPRTGGRTYGAGKDLEQSRDVICSWSSRLGRKKSQVARHGCF